MSKVLWATLSEWTYLFYFVRVLPVRPLIREGSNIVRTESFHAADLAKALRHSNVATMAELKEALGTAVDVTVFRKLKHLAYRTSYSHRGSYYTLDETARFDENGL